jgi:ABC-type microcin C transport system permease subunit YejB
MRAYVIRRLLLVVPTLLAVTLAVFMTVRFIPGSTIDLMIAEMQVGGGDFDPEAIRANLMHQLSAVYCKETSESLSGNRTRRRYHRMRRPDPGRGAS